MSNSASGFIGPCFAGTIATGSFTHALSTIAMNMAAGPAVLFTAERRMQRLDGSLS